MKGNLKQGMLDAQGVASGLDGTLKGLQNTVVGLFAADKVTDFARKILNVRGEVDALLISFETLAGAEKGRELFGDIRSFATSTPMMMQDLAQGAQTLLGFNVEAGKVMPILRQIGDIAMGDSQKFNSLTLAFAQMYSTGKLMGQDLLQMINAGFNPLTVMAERTGKSVSRLKEEMSAGKITVEMVADAFEAATAEGGKFHGMLEKQSKGIKGAMSNLEGAWEDALNDKGEQIQGVMLDVIDMTTVAVKNYDKLGTAILTIVAAYGEYKGSLMAIEALQNVIANQKAAIETARVSELQGLANEYQSSLNTAGIDSETAATQANTAAKEGNAAAINTEVAAIENELRARLASAEANAASAFSEHELANQMVDDAVRKVAAAQEELDAAMRNGDAKAIQSAQEGLNTAVKERNTAEELRNAAAKNSSTAYTQKQTAAQQLSTFQTQVDTIQKNANTKATGLWAAATSLCTKAMHGLKAAVMSNPFGTALVAITSVIGLLSLFSSETEDAADSLGRFRKKVLEEQSQLDSYHAVLSHVEKGTKSYKTALEGINSLAREYNVEQTGVNDTLEEQTQKYDMLTLAIRKQAAEKTIVEASAKANEAAMQSEKDAMDGLVKQAAELEVVLSSSTSSSTWGTYTNEVREAATNVRNITTATWNMISADVMGHARQISEAFAKSDADGEKAVEEQVASIEGMLLQLGVTDKEIEAFHDSLYDYVESTAKGFVTAYKELDRTKAQLGGVANSIVDTKDITNDAIDDMNYEQLVAKAAEVQKKIDELNKDEVKIKTDTTQLDRLKSLLQQINGLIPGKLAEGSEADLERRLKEAKDKRSAAMPGSSDWKEADKDVGLLSTRLNKIQALHSESKDRKDRKDRKEDPFVKKKREQQRYLELRQEQETERRRQAEDLAAETLQHEIDTMEEGSEKSIAQINHDYEKRRKEIERAYEGLKRAKTEAAKKLFEADPDNGKKVFDPSSVDTSYTEEEIKNHNKALEANEKERERSTRAVYEKEAQAMRDFLKEYGSYQQQKLAIAEDYSEKIRKAQTEGERLKLEKERNRQLEQVDVAAIKQSIDWGSLFGEFGAMFKDQLEPTLDKLRAITQSEGFMQSPVEEQQIVYELISKLEASAAVWDGNIFMQVSEDMETYQQSMQALIAAQEREKQVYSETAEALRTARQSLLEAQANKDDSSVSRWEEEVKRLTETQQTASENVQACSLAANEATVNLKASADRAKNMFSELEGAINGLSSGSLKGIGQGLMQLDKLFGGGEMTKQVGNALAKGVQNLFGDSEVGKNLAGALGDSGMMGEIISACLGIFDMIAENGVSGIITGLQDTIFGAVEGLLNDVFSGEIITKPLGNMMEHMNNILDTVTFGGFSKLTSWLGDGDSDKNLERDIERLTKSNQDLKQAIDNLADEMRESKMSEAGSLYEQQKKNIRELEKNVQESMARSGAAYTNGHWYKAYTDGKHSSNKKIDDGMSGKEWDAISELVGKSVRSAGDFWSLSSKEMYEVATKLTSEYTHLKDLADNGYKDASQYMDDYITYWKELEEIENTYREKMTGLSFDSARSSFSSLVKDVKNGTKEMLASVDEMFENAVMNWLMSERYSDRLQEWYGRFAEYMKEGLEKGEAQELRSWYGQIFEDMNWERDAAYEAAGIEPDSGGTKQSGKSGSFETMTQDQGTKLEGLFTSGQIHWASMDSLLGKIADRWNGLMDHLGELVENTSYCRKLSDIADDIKAMRRDGLKMK